MIYCFCGIYEDTYDEAIRGNGKTITMVKMLYLKHLKTGRPVFTNFYTSFGEAVKIREIVDDLKNNKYNEILVGISEVSALLPSIGGLKKEDKLLLEIVKQSRKNDIDFYWDDNRFADVRNRLRYHTNRRYRVKKYHKDDKSHCDIDQCLESHFIAVYYKLPNNRGYVPLKETVDCNKWGQYYNTKELILE